MSRDRWMIVAIISACLLVGFAYTVWPTPYRYGTVSGAGRVYPMRIDRLSGEVEVNTGQGWRSWGN